MVDVQVFISNEFQSAINMIAIVITVSGWYFSLRLSQEQLKRVLPAFLSVLETV